MCWSRLTSRSGWRRRRASSPREVPSPMAVAHAGDMAGHGHSHGPVRSEPRSPWLHGSWLRALWVSFLFAFIAIGISAFIRYLLGDPLHGAEMQEVAATFGLTFWAIGFTVGIGCFDYWWGYIIGSPNWVQEDHSAHGAYSWRDYFKVNTDHKVIGIQYLVLTFIFFMIGGALAEGVRAELAAPGTQYFSPGTYNGLFSAHADRKSTRLNSSHANISYAVFCLKK